MFLMWFSRFLYKCSQQAQNLARTITLVYVHSAPCTVSAQHKAAQACKNPPWAELNLYSAHDYNSTRLVFLNRLSVFQNPFFPSFLCDTKRYMLIDNQQCWFSGAFSANLCPSGCQRVFTATSVPTLLAVPAPVGGAKAWQGLSMLSDGARQSQWKWLRLLASCQIEKSICRQWLAFTVAPVSRTLLTAAKERREKKKKTERETGAAVNIM